MPARIEVDRRFDERSRHQRHAFFHLRNGKGGGRGVGPKIIDAGVKKRMKAALKDIQSGKFAQGWINEYNGGYKKYNALLKAGQNHPVERVGQRLRSLMPWMKKRSVKGAQASY